MAVVVPTLRHVELVGGIDADAARRMVAATGFDRLTHLELRHAPLGPGALEILAASPALGNLRWGVQMARRGWVRPEDVLNTRELTDFRQRLRRHRTR